MLRTSLKYVFNKSDLRQNIMVWYFNFQGKHKNIQKFTYYYLEMKTVIITNALPVARVYIFLEQIMILNVYPLFKYWLVGNKLGKINIGERWYTTTNGLNTHFWEMLPCDINK